MKRFTLEEFINTAKENNHDPITIIHLIYKLILFLHKYHHNVGKAHLNLLKLIIKKEEGIPLIDSLEFDTLDERENIKSHLLAIEEFSQIKPKELESLLHMANDEETREMQLMKVDVWCVGLILVKLLKLVGFQ